MAHEVTRLIDAAITGDRQAAADLLPLVYGELRKLALTRLADESPGNTLQATALVHEAYLRLVGTSDPKWKGRGHFFAAASEAMRRILVDAARRKVRPKHGGDLDRIDLHNLTIEAPEIREDLLALDQALEMLRAVDGTAYELIQLRYFGGLTSSQAADVLNISPRTADRVWTFARAWLRREIQDSDNIA